MQVYYDPSKHWLPQRTPQTDYERQNIMSEERAAAGAVKPPSARDGWIHAVPLVAVPPGMDLSKVVNEWLVAPKT